MTLTCLLAQMVHQADYVVPVEIENQFHNVYVIKRPGVDGAPLSFAHHALRPAIH